MGSADTAFLKFLTSSFVMQQSGLAFGSSHGYGLAATPTGSHGSHMTPPPHEDEDDTPPKTHSVHS